MMWLCQIVISTSDIDVTEWKGDILAVGLSSSDLEKDESGVFKNEKLRKLDEFLKGILGAVIAEEDFKGKGLTRRTSMNDPLCVIAPEHEHVINKPPDSTHFIASVFRFRYMPIARCRTWHHLMLNNILCYYDSLYSSKNLRGIIRELAVK